MSEKYGSQFVTVSIDAKKNTNFNSGYEIIINNGQDSVGIDLLDWIEFAEKEGAGEIFINSVVNDGNKQGYDLNLLKLVSSKTSLPVIAMGGVNKWSHFEDGINVGKAQAVAAGNIFHYSEHVQRKRKII